MCVSTSRLRIKGVSGKRHCQWLPTADYIRPNRGNSTRKPESAGVAMRGMARGYAAGGLSRPGWREIAGTLGQLQAGRQAGNGMACSRAKARLNWVSQGQRRGRCKVRRRAERVIRPTRAKTRRLRVLVVTICSTQADAGCPAGQVMRHHLDRQPRHRWRRSAPTACGSARRRT